MYTGIVYCKNVVLVCIQLDSYPPLVQYDSILNIYAEKYDIVREHLRLCVFHTVPDPRNS